MEFDEARAVCEFCLAPNSDESMLFWIEHDSLDLIWEVFGHDAAIGYVSGLHVEDNLQILQATENLKKSNKVEVGPEIRSSRRPKMDTAPLTEQIWRDIYPPKPPTDLTPRLRKRQS